MTTENKNYRYYTYKYNNQLLTSPTTKVKKRVKKKT